MTSEGCTHPIWEAAKENRSWRLHKPVILLHFPSTSPPYGKVCAQPKSPWSSGQLHVEESNRGNV